MQNEQHQLENKIHTERIIRRRIKDEKRKISDGDRAALTAMCLQEAAEESASWEHRKARIEFVIHEYIAGRIALDGVVDEPEAAPIAPEVPESPPIPSGYTPLAQFDLNPSVMASMESVGVVSLEHLVAFVESGKDLTEINGIGVATAAKLKALLEPEEEAPEAPEEDLDPEDEELEAD